MGKTRSFDDLVFPIKKMIRGFLLRSLEPFQTTDQANLSEEKMPYISIVMARALLLVMSKVVQVQYKEGPKYSSDLLFVLIFYQLIISILNKFF